MEGNYLKDYFYNYLKQNAALAEKIIRSNDKYFFVVDLDNQDNIWFSGLLWKKLGFKTKQVIDDLTYWKNTVFVFDFKKVTFEKMISDGISKFDLTLLNNNSYEIPFKVDFHVNEDNTKILGILTSIKDKNNLNLTQNQFELLLELYKSNFDNYKSIENVYEAISKTAALGLNVDRASFWKFNDEKLVCQCLYDRDKEKTVKDSDLNAKDFPKYFDALQRGLAIVADDAHTNENTSEFTDIYLKPLGITDMLDIPLRENGKVVGVFCCEHRDEPRVWIDSDVTFARCLVDIYTLFNEENKRVLLTQELHENREKFEFIAENSSDGIMIIEDSKVVYISPSFTKFSGYTIDEASNISIDEIFDLIHPDDKELIKNKVYNSLNSKITSFTMEYRFKNKSGNYYWREDLTNVIYNKDGSYSRYFVIIRDIDKRKKAELELIKMYDISKRQNEKLLNFTHIVSHNIRSHSSNLTMLLNLFEDSENNTEKEEYVNLFKDCLYKLSDTIFHLNETIKINHGQGKIIAKVNVKQEIQKVLNIVSALLLNNNAEIEINIPDDMTLKVIPSYFESVILNLVTNSLKYKSVNTNPKIQIFLTKNDVYTIINFKDNGIGIDLKRNGDKIFGMYKTFHDNPDAVGLGLFMIKNQMEFMNGKIEVESALGNGSTFKLFFYEKN